MSGYSKNDVDSLATKIAGLDLGEGEAAVLGALLDACDSEVAGFGGRRGILIDFTGPGAKIDRSALAEGLHSALGSGVATRRILPTGETAQF